MMVDGTKRSHDVQTLILCLVYSRSARVERRVDQVLARLNKVGKPTSTETDVSRPLKVLYNSKNSKKRPTSSI